MLVWAASILVPSNWMRSRTELLWIEWQPAPASDSMIMDKTGRVRRIMEDSFCSLTDGLVIGAPAAQHPPILGYRFE